MNSTKYEHDSRHQKCDKNASTNQKKFLISAMIIASFMFVEVIGGVISGSLALISDAGHMLSDFAALIMAWVASYISTRKPDMKRSYGYSRFPILVAYSNALFMFAVIGWIFYNAIVRFFEPVEVMSTTMLIVATIGLIVNIIVFLILHIGNKDHYDLNVRSAAVHVLGDLLGSVSAIVAALIIMFTGWTPIDPILSIFITLIIIHHTIPILKKTSHILMQGSPEIDIDEVRETLLKEIELLEDVDHIHLWYQDDSQVIATMHIKVHNCGDFNNIRFQVRDILINKFNVNHVTIELETNTVCEH